MLGNLHTSDIRRYVPRLIDVGKSKSGSHVFMLDWDSVDAYKLECHQQWVEEHWRDKAPPTPPETLPAEYDKEVKALRFCLNHNYKTEIEHFSRLFVAEHTRTRKFDTCVRDRCHQTAVSAIGNAFYLLTDCTYNVAQGEWYKGPFKRVYQHMVTYKFWRGLTGRGLCWTHAEFDKLEESAKFFVENSDPFAGTCEDGLIFSGVINMMKMWEEEQEKLFAHASVEV